jgi:uncharacterized DUF497 family protein
MNIQWDPKKAVSNLKKHGVDFADAAVALEDENALTIDDVDHDEQRFKTLGMGAELKILFVVFSIVDHDGIRMISARKATRNETKQYFMGLKNE